MQFEMSFDILKILLMTEANIRQDTGIHLDFAADNLVSDFFELCALCKDRRVALQADRIWAGLIKANSDMDKRRLLNQYRASMQDAITRQAEMAA